MGITWQALYTALGRTVKAALAGAGIAAELRQSDIKRPVTRRQVKIDLTDCTASGDDDAAAYSYDAEIYFYPQNAQRPRDECMTAASAIAGALRSGQMVDGLHIPIPDGISTEMVDGVLAASFTLEWLETAADEGEMLETLEMREERDIWQ